MLSSMVSFAAGVACGWVARSIADTPQGVGVKVLEATMNAKDRIVRWAALECERLEDMMAEVQAKRGQAGPNGKPPTDPQPKERNAA
jgi:hypothetical protein